MIKKVIKLKTKKQLNKKRIQIIKIKHFLTINFKDAKTLIQ